MAEGSVDDIFVEIQVRLDKLEAGMRRAEQTVNQSIQRMDRRTSQGIFGDRFLQNTLRSVARITAAFAVVRGAVGAIDLGVDLWQLGMAKIRGDTERVADELESIRGKGSRIPFIGPAAQGITALIANIGGFDTPEKKLQDTLKKIEEAKAALTRGEAALAFGRELAVQAKILIALREQDKSKRIQLELEARLFEIELQRQELIEKGITQRKAGQFADIESEKARLRAEERLRKLSGRSGDPTQSFIVALGNAVFGTGGGSPTKTLQDKQVRLTTQSNQHLAVIADAVQEIGFA